MKFEIINTTRYYIKRIQLIVFGILTFAAYLIIFPHRRVPSLLLKLNIPEILKWFIILWGVFSFIVFFKLFLQSVRSKKQEIEFTDNSIVFDGKILLFQHIESISLFLNPEKNKLVYYREIKSFGGNNWLEIITKAGHYYKIELLIPSLKSENRMLELFDLWSKFGILTEKKQSKKLFWENFM